MEKRKYGGLIIILTLLIVLPIAAVYLTKDYISESDSSKVVYFVTSILLFAMSFIIYKKERLYWLNGYRYKDVIKMSPEHRQRLCEIFFRYFGSTTMIISIYMLIGIVLKTNFWLDFVVFLGGVLYAAIIIYIKMNVKEEIE